MKIVLFLAALVWVPLVSLHAAPSQPIVPHEVPDETKTASSIEREETGIYCKLTSDELRERLGELRGDFTTSIVAVDELEMGYRYWFDNSKGRLVKLAEFVDFESQCCGFLDFAIELEGESDRISLSLTGKEGTKDYLRTVAETSEFELERALKDSVSQP